MTTTEVMPLMTAEEVAELLGVTVEWVWARSRDGTLPAIKLGRSWRYRQGALQAWLHDQEQAA